MQRGQLILSSMDALVFNIKQHTMVYKITRFLLWISTEDSLASNVGLKHLSKEMKLVTLCAETRAGANTQQMEITGA